MKVHTITVLMGTMVVIVVSGIARGELLINPGAETGNLSGWTIGGVSNPFVDNGSFDPGINPHTGLHDFVGGTGLSGTLTQNVSLLGVPDISNVQIDAGLVSATVSFWEQGLNQGDPSDNGSVMLTFRDSTNAVLGTASTPVIDSHQGTWQDFAGDFAVLPGTRSIDYTMVFTRHVGSDLDTFFDDNSLTVSTSTSAVAPEPASLVLLATGVFVLLGYRGCRRGTARP